MEDVSRLIEKASQDLGPDASDEQITARVLKTIETLPDPERAEVLEELVKRTDSRELAHLRKEADDTRPAGNGESGPDNTTAPS